MKRKLFLFLALMLGFVSSIKADVDYTSKMSSTGWTGQSGSWNGGPECYNGNDTQFSVGDVLYETISDLPNGNYEISFYAFENFANWNDKASIAYGRNIAQAFANESRQDFNVIKNKGGRAFDENTLHTMYVQVTNGTLKYGVKNIKAGGNWAVCKPVSLTYKGETLPNNTDLTSVISNWDFKESANNDFLGWTIYAPNGGNTQILGDTKVEYWIGTAANGVFDYYQTITGLPAAKYIISGSMWNSTNGESPAPAGVNETAGVYGTSGAITVFKGVNVDGDQCNTYTTDQIAVTNGTLRIGVKNNGTMGARWFGVDWIKLTYVEAISLQDYYDQIAELIDVADDITAKQNADTKAELDDAVDEGQGYIDDEETDISKLQASIDRLTDAIEGANASVAVYAAINSAISNYATRVTALDAAGQAAYDASAIQTKYDNGTYETLAEAEAELSAAYLTAVVSQTTNDWKNVMVNPAVTSTTGWTNGRTNSGQQYTDAPDNTYMDTWNDNRDQNQTVTLPEGYYLLVAATRADANVTVGNIYAYSGDSNLGSEDIQMEGSTGNLLGNGWAWTRVPFHVTETSSVKIGFYSECGGSKWAGADDFHLYYYTTELAMKQGQLAQVVSDANAWAGKLTTTTALEEALSASAPSCSTVEECNTAISNLETTIANARAAEAPYASFNALKTAANAIADVDYKETISGSHATFTTAISAQTTAADEATTAAAVNTAISTLTSAIKTYIAAAEPLNEGEYFDITCLIVNPSFDNNNATGWSGTTPNAITYGCAEFFNMNFDFYQNITGLANGSYQLSVQAFCRPGDNGTTSAGAYYDYKQGINNITAELYVNSDESTIGNIYSYKDNTTGAKVVGNDFHCNISPDDYWVPNNMQGASLYFANDAYNTTVAALVEDGNLKIGFREENKKTNQWVIFDNFRLYYYGSSKLVYYQQYLPQLKAEVTSDLANAAYVNVTGKERGDLETANAATPASETEVAYKAVIDDIKEKQAAFKDAKPSYDALVTAKAASVITKITENIGTGVFQYNETTNDELYSAYETSKGAVDDYTVTSSTTASVVQALLDAIDDAIDDYYNQPLNAPDAEKRYVLTIVEDGKAWNGNAVTFRENCGDNTDQGNFGIKYQTPTNVKYNQAIKFSAAGDNKYKLSVTSADGTEMYLTTSKKGYNKDDGGFGDERIRMTSDATKALEVEIRATSTDNQFQLYNSTAPGIIANNDNNDMYTAGSCNFTIAEAVKVSPNLVIAAGVNWATFMSPFAISLSSLEDVTAFRITGTENDEMVTEEVTTTIPANTPVLLYRKTTGSNYAPSLSGYGAAYQDTYTAGLLKGSYVKSEVPASSETENNYLLQKNNDVVAFYNVASSSLFIGAYRAYLSMSATSARPVIFFPEEDDPTAINAIEAADAEAEGLKDGKYLIDGQIIIVKNGVKYSANGQILK